MENNSVISDHELHSLFKQKFLEDGADNALTEKLLDLEAKFVFASEALIIPARQKEQELISKLSKSLGSKINSVWLFLGLGVAAITIYTIVKTDTSPTQNSDLKSTTEQKIIPPSDYKNVIVVNDTNRQEKVFGQGTRTTFSGEFNTETVMQADSPQPNIGKQKLDMLTVANANNVLINPPLSQTGCRAPGDVIPNTNTIAPVHSAEAPSFSPTVKDFPVNTNFTIIPPVIYQIRKAGTKNAKSILSYKCKILDTKSFCNVTAGLRAAHPKNSTQFYGSMTTFGCNDVNKNQAMKLVMLSIEVNEETKFTLETGFKNVVLAFKDGERYQRPIAIEGSGLGFTSNTYVQCDIKVEKMVSRFKDHLDLILVFENAEPGDKIIFNDLIEATIEQ
jgi:hypothetical protein